MKTYTITATRKVAVRYLARELGGKAASSLRNANGKMPCAAMFGAIRSSLDSQVMTAEFRTKRQADEFRNRVDSMASEIAGRLHRPASLCFQSYNKLA